MDWIPAVARNKEADVIKAGTTRVASLSMIVAGLSGIVVAFNGVIADLFSGNTNHEKLVLLVALLAVWAVIVASDLIARAVATSAETKAKDTVSPAPPGIVVRRPDLEHSESQPGWTVAAIDTSGEGEDKVRFLLVKPNQTPVWVAASSVQGDPPVVSPTPTAKPGKKSK